MTDVADPLSLLGEWRLWRRVTDRRAGLSGTVDRTAFSAPGSPASAATTSWLASSSPWAARSATIGSFA